MKSVKIIIVIKTLIIKGVDNNNEQIISLSKELVVGDAHSALFITFASQFFGLLESIPGWIRIQSRIDSNNLYSWEGKSAVVLKFHCKTD